MSSSEEFDPQPQLLKGFRLKGQVAKKNLVPPAVPEPLFDSPELPEEIGEAYTNHREENILVFKRPEKK